jgi:hypothetical protein
MSEYPLEMHHPSFSAGTPAVFAVPNDGSGQQAGTMLKKGVPGRFPPVTVVSEKDEEYHRAQGYLAKGETPVHVQGFHQYPKMLVHPDHVPGTPDEIHAEPREEGKPLKTYMVKGTPEKFPPVTVNSPEEEAEWNAKGYHMPKLPDPTAFQRSRSVPYDPHRTVNGYPRWENGVLVNDPALGNSGVKEYPKWVRAREATEGDDGMVLVNSAKEEFELLEAGEFTDAKVQYMIGERRHLSEIGDEAGVERIEKMLADAGIQIKDRPHGTVWTRVEKTEEPAPETDERAALIAEAEAKGVKIDKRWNVEKLRAALESQAA